jgi:hypothetical protein
MKLFLYNCHIRANFTKERNILPRLKWKNAQKAPVSGFSSKKDHERINWLI